MHPHTTHFITALIFQTLNFIIIQLMFPHMLLPPLIFPIFPSSYLPKTPICLYFPHSYPLSPPKTLSLFFLTSISLIFLFFYIPFEFLFKNAKFPFLISIPCKNHLISFFFFIFLVSSRPCIFFSHFSITVSLLKTLISFFSYIPFKKNIHFPSFSLLPSFLTTLFFVLIFPV